MLPSLLDNDLYKLTMMHAVWKKYPDARVTYAFINRRPSDRFSGEFLELLQERIEALRDLRLLKEERAWLETLGIFGEDFLDYLMGFRLDPATVDAGLSEDGQLQLAIAGSWHETILWEVPLLALISETYFEVVDKKWDGDLAAYYEKTLRKGIRMSEAGCQFADFGTRRRRSYAAHEAVVRAFIEVARHTKSTFVGTSNVHLARLLGTAPIGTMAHEWIMGHAGMFGVAGANGKALESWIEVFGEKLLIALTDTYTTELFFKEFRGELAESYDGIRHDSDCPFTFAEKARAFYEEAGIDPKSKRIVFSDSLDVDAAVEIQQRTENVTNPVFGIGTHFTNDFEGSPALNIVIKMASINGKPVAKLSDAPGKASGDGAAIRESLDIVRKMTRSGCE